MAHVLVIFLRHAGRESCISQYYECEAIYVGFKFRFFFFKLSLLQLVRKIHFLRVHFLGKTVLWIPVWNSNNCSGFRGPRYNYYLNLTQAQFRTINRKAPLSRRGGRRSQLGFSLVSTHIVCVRDYLWCTSFQNVARQNLCSNSSEHPVLEFGSENQPPPPQYYCAVQIWPFPEHPPATPKNLKTLIVFPESKSDLFRNTPLPCALPPPPSPPPPGKLKFRQILALWVLTFQNTPPLKFLKFENNSNFLSWVQIWPFPEHPAPPPPSHPPPGKNSSIFARNVFSLYRCMASKIVSLTNIINRYQHHKSAVLAVINYSTH